MAPKRPRQASSRDSCFREGPVSSCPGLFVFNKILGTHKVIYHACNYKAQQNTLNPSLSLRNLSGLYNCHMLSPWKEEDSCDVRYKGGAAPGGHSVPVSLRQRDQGFTSGRGVPGTQYLGRLLPGASSTAEGIQWLPYLENILAFHMFQRILLLP